MPSSLISPQPTLNSVRNRNRPPHEPSPIVLYDVPRFFCDHFPSRRNPSLLPLLFASLRCIRLKLQATKRPYERNRKRSPTTPAFNLVFDLSVSALLIAVHRVFAPYLVLDTWNVGSVCGVVVVQSLRPTCPPFD
ncbi:hypothetical protein GALMADRAFT_453119 [Galerina marginata CBS 339.88]|uniref:Uncharacterized protein n=1 Tax=Galerina marginata (strain CBS 339.88) TaxID=685588 RepID=A0A067T0M2_GALM3|nr:hypothetical protein GALMADRAFT_453119 [Galerina marginata CBS 339.88]